MKHAFLLFAVMLLFISVSSAQMYVRAGLGYGFSLGSTLIDQNYDYSYVSTLTTSNYTRTSDGVYGTFGKGINFAGAIGKTIDNHIMAELGIQYFVGPSYDVTNTYKDSYASTGYSYGYSQTQTFTYKAHMLAFVPAVIVYTDLGKFSPFIRMGFTLAFPKITIDSSRNTTSTTNDSVTSSSTYTGKGELSGNMAMGLTGSAGAMIPLTDKMNIVAELTFANISWSPDQNSWSNTQTSGTSTISNSGTFHYSENLSYKSGTTSSTDKLSPRYPFGFYGLNISLMYTL